MVKLLIADYEYSFCKKVGEEMERRFDVQILLATTLSEFRVHAFTADVIVIGPMLDGGKTTPYETIAYVCRKRSYMIPIVGCSCAHNRELLEAGCSTTVEGYWELLGILNELLSASARKT